MPTQKQIFKCEVCGNIIEVLHGGEGDLVCCGQNMTLFDEKAADEGKEKHFIEWIELIDSDKTYRHYLKPGQSPETIFETRNKGVIAREYCSVHGLWKS
jgi:superoxide reductase